MPKPPRQKPLLSKRRAARFAAVQALYQVEMSRADSREVAVEFVRHRLPQLLEPLGLTDLSPAVDEPFFAQLVVETWKAREELDAIIATALAPGWSLERCGYVLRALLRAGVFELAHRPDVPVSVVIDEYVEVARLFFAGNEPGFVNAVLDRLAPQLRKDPTLP